MSNAAPFVDISPTLRILGTAHVATASVEAVREQIETYQPKVVGVELCQTKTPRIIFFLRFQDVPSHIAHD